MGCAMCEVATNEGDKHYYYRWKNANILIIGCKVHVKEIFDVLSNYQKDSYENIKK